MQFESWQAFFHMAGHGPYVWSAYGITALTLAALIFVPALRNRQRRRELRERYRRGGQC